MYSCAYLYLSTTCSISSLGNGQSSYLEIQFRKTHPSYRSVSNMYLQTYDSNFIRDVSVSLFLCEVIIQLSGYEKDLFDFVRILASCGIIQHRLEASTAIHIIKRADGNLQMIRLSNMELSIYIWIIYRRFEQGLWRHHDQRLSIRTVDLTAKYVEVLRWRRTIDDRPVRWDIIGLVDIEWIIAHLGKR